MTFWHAAKALQLRRHQYAEHGLKPHSAPNPAVASEHRLVIMALAANFAVVPVAACVLSRVIPLDESGRIGLHPLGLILAFGAAVLISAIAYDLVEDAFGAVGGSDGRVQAEDDHQRSDPEERQQ
jgi:hypothetical protein